LVFKKNAKFFGENWQKSQCDHSIDPSGRFHQTLFQPKAFWINFSFKYRS
jgi:hypothetical protein